MQLSEHFSLMELTNTDQREFIQLNYTEAEHDPRVLSALKSLCSDLLEPIRAHYGKPVSVHSGFRMAPLNAAVKGQPGSQHIKGEAADFHISGLYTPDGLRQIFDWIKLDSRLSWGQLILEGRPARWIHISLGAPFRPAAKCGQVLIATPDGKGGMRYESA